MSSVERGELELLLKVQQSAFRESVDVLVSSFKQQIERLELLVKENSDTISDLRAENNSKQRIIESLQSRLDDLEVTVEGCRFDADPIYDKLSDLEDRSRRNNLRFDGIQEKDLGENSEQSEALVRKILTDNLKISEKIEIERAHRVGPRNSKSLRSRTVVVRFLKSKDRDLVLRNSNKLKGSNIFINEDLSDSSIKKRKDLLPKLHEARRNGKVAFFRHTKLIIRESGSISTAPVENTTDGESRPELLASGVTLRKSKSNK